MLHADLPLDVLADGLAGDSHQAQVDEVLLGQFIEDCRKTAVSVEIEHMIRACRCQVAQVRDLGAVFIEYMQVDRAARLFRDGQQVQDGVRRAAERHVAGECVADRFFVDDVEDADVLLDHFHDLHTGLFGETDTAAHDSRDGPVARERDADGFAQAVHAVGGVHAGAAAAAGADVLFERAQPFIVDDARFMGTDRLEHLGQARFFAFHQTGQHRAAGADDGGQIDADGADQLPGNDLVAVGHEHEAVEHVAHRHGLDAVRNEFAARQRVLHAFVAHRDAVTDTDRREFDRGAAGHADAGLDGFCDLVEVGMARDDLAVRVDHADQRTLQFLFGVPHGVEQAAHRRAFRAFGDAVTSHGFGILSH